MHYLASRWLIEHGLTESDIQQWGGKVNPDSIKMPCYSLNGGFQFHIIRRLEELPRYRYDPQGCRISMQLFGGYQAMPHILNEHVSVTCEGFSDVLALHKVGVQNSVSLLGSFMSRTQFHLLHLLSDRIIMWVDGDAAGRDSGTQVQKKHGSAIITTLEVEGLDPAEAVAKGKPVLRWIDYAQELSKTAEQIRLDANGELLQLVLRDA